MVISKRFAIGARPVPTGAVRLNTTAGRIAPLIRNSRPATRGGNVR